MNGNKLSLEGPGRLQWNFGGWFGSAIGSSVWMLILGVLLMTNGQPTLSLVPWLSFGLAFIVAVILWWCRDRVLPRTAMVIELSLLAVLFPTTWYSVQAWASPRTLDALNIPDSNFAAIVVTLTVPAVLAALLWMDGKPISPSPTAKDSGDAKRSG